MIFCLVNENKLQFLLVLLRLLFESGIAKPHTAFKLCLVFDDVHRNRLFTFPAELKVSPCFFFPSF